MLSSEMVVALWPWCLPAGLVLPDLAPELADLGPTLATLATDGALTMPRPGLGATMDRFIALAETSAVDLSLGRLVEGHADAVAILAEAGRRPPPAAVMGVWAARRPGAEVTATAVGTGWRLQGCKPWASGARALTHALVTAAGKDGDRLFLVPVGGADGVRPVPGTWPAVGMARSDSADVEVDLVVGHDAAIGPPGWYVERPGFWMGSVGVAGCWLGGALGLVRALRTDLAQRRPDPHQLAHLGAAAARCASMARDLDWAAGRIDADPAAALRPVALEVRQLIEDGCLDVMGHVGRGGGAGPLCHDAAQSRRMADLPVYIRQHHAERDAAELGRFLLTGDAEG